VLGTHVEQKSSFVSADYLRFDFSHFSKVTDEELVEIETLVNNAIRANIELDEHRNLPIEEAKNMGAMALFGEKYGDNVRVIRFGNSIELCGGTHVPSTGKIGMFKLTTETAVAAGIRRIEAITNKTAENLLRKKADSLDEISSILKNPKNLKSAIEELIQKNSQLQKQIEGFQKEKAMLVKADLKAKITYKNGVNLLAEKINLDAGSIKDIVYQLKGEVDNFAAVIGGVEGDKCSITIIFADQIVTDKNIDAGKIIREVSKHIQGGGGGQAFFATAGGKNPAGLDKAISEVVGMI
jgi:alanyl-tRNA synthetase